MPLHKSQQNIPNIPQSSPQGPPVDPGPGLPPQGPVGTPPSVPIGPQPAVPGGVDPTNQVGAIATPEQIQQLKELLESIRSKISDVNTSRFSQKNTGESGRADALREMFLLLQRAGVDLSNPQAVNLFLEAMRKANPELAQSFEEILNQLLGGESTVLPEDQLPGQPLEQPLGQPLEQPLEQPLGQPLGQPLEQGGGILPDNEINNETLPQNIRGPLPKGFQGGQPG